MVVAVKGGGPTLRHVCLMQACASTHACTRGITLGRPWQCATSGHREAAQWILAQWILAVARSKASSTPIAVLNQGPALHSPCAGTPLTPLLSIAGPSNTLAKAPSPCCDGLRPDPVLGSVLTQGCPG
jgi:hypothetical protein